MFDVLVIGSGPAGICAAIYAKRAGRDVAIIEKVAPGGQLNVIGEIENYPGFESIEGPELASKFVEHAKSFDIPFLYDEVVNIEFVGNVKNVICNGQTYQAYSVILALGSNCRELGIEGEDRLKGSGVSYCAICDGRFFKGKNVAVVGSGDSAISDAVYLSSLCDKVYLLTKPSLKMYNYTLNDITSEQNISLLQGAISKKIEGQNQVESLTYVKDGKEEILKVDGIFVAVGRKPDTEFLSEKIKLDNAGYIIVDENMQTSIEGVYACGNVVQGNLKQISIAVGQGAIAGTSASKYALKQKLTK